MQMQDPIGQQLGNYRLLSLLGKGGFARVYLGEHIYLGNQAKAAIKVLNETKLSDEDRQGFITEARNIRKLNHPHIIKVLEFGIEVSRTMDASIPYLVMDFAPYGSLRNRHPRNTIVSMQQIVLYVSQIADALEYAHDKGIVHRDVKPENMLMMEPNEIVLSDFGIAIADHDSKNIALKNEDAVQGTFAYLAPERFLGTTRRASDQYSLGIVIYEWLTGVHPFKDTPERIIFMHINTPPPPPSKFNPHIAQEVEKVVLRSLAKDPEERYPSVKAFAQALIAAIQTSTQSEYRVAKPEYTGQNPPLKNSEQPTQYPQSSGEPTQWADKPVFSVKFTSEGYAKAKEPFQQEKQQEDLEQPSVDSEEQALEADTDKLQEGNRWQHQAADADRQHPEQQVDVDETLIASPQVQYHVDAEEQQQRWQPVADDDEQDDVYPEPQQPKQRRQTQGFRRHQQQQTYQSGREQDYSQQHPGYQDYQTWQPGEEYGSHETARSTFFTMAAPDTSSILVQKKATAGKRQTFGTSLSKTLREWFELDSEFARIPKNKTFRNVGVVLNILSAILLGLLHQPPSGWFILWGLLYSLLFFNLCIRLVKLILSIAAGLLVALYWTYFSIVVWNALYQYGPYIPRFSPFLITFLPPTLSALFVFIVSAYLHIRYALDRLP